MNLIYGLDVTSPKTNQPILVVEDSDDIRFLLVELLQDEGHTVIAVRSGEEAIKQALVCKPSLILMDISLPGIDGWETVKRLREITQFSATPIFALTGYVGQQHQDQAMAVGCTGFISKPFDMDVLLAQVANSLPVNCLN